jgi:hypothetical protein
MKVSISKSKDYWNRKLFCKKGAHRKAYKL